MSSGHFGLGEVNEYYPVHSDVDWYDAYTATGQEHKAPVWFEAEDNLGALVLQCHQENMSFYLNKTNPQLDAIAVEDPRDGMAIWWSREKLGEETFTKMLETFGDEVMVTRTKYPMQTVAAYVLQFIESDIKQFDSFPDEWESA